MAARSHLSGSDKDSFQQLVRTLTSSHESGHSCLPVTEPETRLLKNLHLVSDGGKTPLVLHKQRLYLHRYFHYETRLAEQISAMASVSLHLKGIDCLLDSFFENSESGINWQKEAAKVALQKTLTIICGGPGTGKTTTVVKILALLLLAADNDLEVALAAPTGKAAMRLSESIGSSLNRLKLPEEIKAAIPTQAKTLHRLLGFKRHSPQFKHSGQNPMGWDIVVVDEASMVDLAMMSKLVDALKPGSKLLLLGDKDQLASVESGAVLGDFIKSLPDNTVELKKSYRFDDNIKQLAEKINAGNSEGAWELLSDRNVNNVTILSSDLMDYIGKQYGKFMEEVCRNKEPEVRDIFAAFNSFQVLCGVHFGNRGVEGINRRVELSLARRGFDCRLDSWYPGRPVLITRNDYSLGLFNGDIGICLPDQDEGSVKVWFEQSDGGLKSYSPYRLPKCETVFAMTIHKSQGSEFDEVVVVLPDEDNRILSRELIYTAVTRAKKSVKIVADQLVFTQALSRNIERFSGLADLLQEHSLATKPAGQDTSQPL
ncbi:MAG: exodeoxyribonuclease V subunit alpha [Desulfobulbaceae bacterium]|nr:exodeoxyribonuclease V subunit alpha [Desulfobulbaceae bacterium]